MYFLSHFIMIYNDCYLGYCRRSTMKDVDYMMTSSNGNIFRVTGLLCGEFTGDRPVMRSFDVFFVLRLNKRSSKQSRRVWFETPLRSLWRHCNVAVGMAHTGSWLRVKTPTGQNTEGSKHRRVKTTRIKTPMGQNTEWIKCVYIITKTNSCRAWI